MNSTLNALVNTDASTLSPIALFLQADVIVRIVMVGLIIASVWTWGIIVAQSFKLRRAARDSAQLEREFWQAHDIDAFAQANRGSNAPSAKVVSAGLAEWRLSTAKRNIDREGTRNRLTTSLGAAVSAEIDRLIDPLNYLATVAAVAPFIGLFGTVWGIMRSFSNIAGQQNTSLAVVAPGISEALFATALGLFAAIPSLIAYNVLSHWINRLEARLTRFADGFHATLSRELED